MAVQPSTGKVIKVIELVGTSSESWSDAARNAVVEAAKSIHGITGVDVIHSTATVEDGQIKEYHVDVKLAFVVNREKEEDD